MHLWCFVKKNVMCLYNYSSKNFFNFLEKIIFTPYFLLKKRISEIFCFQIFEAKIFFFVVRKFFVKNKINNRQFRILYIFSKLYKKSFLYKFSFIFAISYVKYKFIINRQLPRYCEHNLFMCKIFLFLFSNKPLARNGNQLY